MAISILDSSNLSENFFNLYIDKKFQILIWLSVQVSTDRKLGSKENRKSHELAENLEQNI